MRAIARYGSTAGINDVTSDVTAYINDVTFDEEITIIQLRYIESHSTLWLYSGQFRRGLVGSL